MHREDFDAIMDKFTPKFEDQGGGIEMCMSMSFGHFNNHPQKMSEALRAGFALHSYPPSKFKWQIVSDLMWRNSTPPAQPSGDEPPAGGAATGGAATGGSSRS